MGGEDPLEDEMATHSSILAWEITWTGETDRLLHEVAKNWTQLNTHTHTHSFIGGASG